MGQMSAIDKSLLRHLSKRYLRRYSSLCVIVDFFVANVRRLKETKIKRPHKPPPNDQKTHIYERTSARRAIKIIIIKKHMSDFVFVCIRARRAWLAVVVSP